jgi:hypothetical protein
VKKTSFAASLVPILLGIAVGCTTASKMEDSPPGSLDKLSGATSQSDAPKGNNNGDGTKSQEERKALSPEELMAQACLDTDAIWSLKTSIQQEQVAAKNTGTPNTDKLEDLAKKISVRKAEIEELFRFYQKRTGRPLDVKSCPKGN